MFFVLSKLFWAVAQPVTALFLLLCLGFVLVLARWRRTGMIVLGTAIAMFGLISLTNLGALIMQPLENRFERPVEMPQNVRAIIVLGGGINSGVSGARKIAELNSAGDRFVEAVRLSRLYPDAKVVISGGHGMLTPGGEADAAVADRFFPALGVDPARLFVEGQSRNTQENVAYTRELIDPKPGEELLLVTSAYHMPRSMGLFRAAELDVIAWPADYKTRGNEGFKVDIAFPQDNIDMVTLGTREWIGLLAYSLTGRIAELLPAP